MQAVSCHWPGTAADSCNRRPSRQLLVQHFFAPPACRSGWCKTAPHSKVLARAEGDTAPGGDYQEQPTVALPERLRHVTAEHTFVVALFLKAQLLLFTQGIDLWLSIPFATGLVVLANMVLTRKWHTQRWFQMVLLLGAIVTLFPYSLFKPHQQPAAAPAAPMQMQQRGRSPEQNPSRLRTPEEAERMIRAMRAAEAARRR